MLREFLFYSSIIIGILLIPVIGAFSSYPLLSDVQICIKYFFPVVSKRGRWNSSILDVFFVINSSGTFIQVDSSSVGSLFSVSGTNHIPLSAPPTFSFFPIRRALNVAFSVLSFVPSTGFSICEIWGDGVITEVTDALIVLSFSFNCSFAQKRASKPVMISASGVSDFIPLQDGSERQDS